MDPLSESVPPGPNLTGGRERGMNTNISTKYMKSKYVRISWRNFSSFKNAL